MSGSISRYNTQKQEVARLLKFHAQLHGVEPAAKGRRAADLEVLHRSAVVLLTACWESFIENILKESIGIIVRDLPDPFALHHELLAAVAASKSSKLSVSVKHELYPWYFVGDGWRTILLQFVALKISDFNTPDAAVKSMFKSLLGVEDVTQSWGRRGKFASDAADRLDEYLSDRHSIAHGAAHQKKLNKSYVTGYQQFLDITVQKTEDVVRVRLKELGLVLP